MPQRHLHRRSRVWSIAAISIPLACSVGCGGVSDALSSLPDTITLPDVTLPDVTLPDVTLPDVTLPDVTLPDVDIPGAIDQLVSGAKGMAVNVLDKAATFDSALSVTDELGHAITGAEVVVDGKVYPVSGTLAALKSISVSKSPTVTIRAPGYASVAVVLDPLRALSGLTVILRAFESVQTFAASAGGTVSLSAVTVTLAPDGVVTLDGKAYTGAVTVSASALDIARDLFSPAGGLDPAAMAKVPDPIIAVETDSGGTPSSLPMLMLASAMTELTGESGQKLQPAPGKPAAVDFTLSPVLAAVFPGAYKAGATLDVASRDDATGHWSTSSTCTVVEGPGGFTCSAALSHFSEAAVVAKATQGCIVVGDLQVAIPEGQSLVWREQTLRGPFDLQLNGHFFDNDGKLGMCAVVPIQLESLFVVGRFQLGAAGAPVLTAPSYADGATFIQTRFAVGKPADVGLSSAATVDTSTAEGCLAACASAPRLEIRFVAAPPPPPPADAKPIELPPPPPVPTYPVVDLTSIDNDGDGSFADADCDDDDKGRFPGGADTCGDGLDQDCSGADTACTMSCFSAMSACMPACLETHGGPTPEGLACVAACTPALALESTEADEAWKALIACFAGCAAAPCGEMICDPEIAACTGDALKCTADVDCGKLPNSDPCSAGKCVNSTCTLVPTCAACADVAPCVFGCKPLQAAGKAAEYASCTTACGLPGLAQDVAATTALEELYTCGQGGGCAASLDACSAKEAAPSSTCAITDMGCYAGLPDCTASFQACFQPAVP